MLIATMMRSMATIQLSLNGHSRPINRSLTLGWSTELFVVSSQQLSVKSLYNAHYTYAYNTCVYINKSNSHHLSMINYHSCWILLEGNNIGIVESGYQFLTIELFHWIPLTTLTMIRSRRNI